MFIKTGDTVVLLTGDYKDKRNDKGELKTGKVIATSPKEGKVIVQGMNIVSKHQKARKQGDQAGIIKVEGAIYADKVMLYCDHCKKGVRAAYESSDGKKTRICAKCRKKI